MTKKNKNDEIPDSNPTFEAMKKALADPKSFKLTPDQIAILNKGRAMEEKSREMPKWLKKLQIRSPLLHTA